MASQDDIIAELRALVEKQAKQIAVQAKQIAALTQEVAELKLKLAKAVDGYNISIECATFNTVSK